MHYPWPMVSCFFPIQPFHPTPNLRSFFYHLRSLRFTITKWTNHDILLHFYKPSSVEVKLIHQAEGLKVRICWARKNKPTPKAPGWCKSGCGFMQKHPRFPYISLEFHWFSEWWSSWQNDPSSCWRFYWNIEDLHPNILKFQPILTTQSETFWLHKNGYLLLWKDTYL